MQTHWPHARRVNDTLDVRDREIGYADRLDLARLEERNHRLPGVDKARLNIELDPAGLARLLRLEVRSPERDRRERDRPVHDCAANAYQHFAMTRWYEEETHGRGRRSRARAA